MLLYILLSQTQFKMTSAAVTVTEVDLRFPLSETLQNRFVFSGLFT